MPIEESEEIDFSSYQKLKALQGKVSAKDIRKALQVIKDMKQIHLFIRKLGRRRTDYIKTCPPNQQGPGWWSWEHDKALIQSLSQYGINIVTTWVADPALPFRQHIPKELLESFDEAAAKEKQKGKLFKPNDIGDFVFLYRERSRVSRSLAVINHVSKEMKKNKKVAEKEKKHHKKSHETENPQFVLKPNPHLRIVSLGKLKNDKQFIRKSTPFPVGFVSERKYKIPGSKGNSLWFKCEIQEQEGKPVFIVSSDKADPPICLTGNDPADVWNQIIDHLVVKANDSTIKTPKVIGNSMFGLVNPTVQEELSKLEGAKHMKCFSKFNEEPKFLEFRIDVPLINK